MSRFATAAAAALAVTCSAWVLGASHITDVAASQDGRMAAAADIDDAMDALAERIRALPRDEFDPIAVVEQVGRDPAALAEWIRANTRWAPYQGALRGAVGVMNDRVGSSLDRALLLAEVLRLAGHQTRLAHATLDPPAAQGLAQELLRAPPPPLEENVGVSSIIAKRAADHSARLRSVLAAAGIGADRPPDEQTAAQAAANHWWVQRRDGDGWVDMDVTGASVSAQETFEAPGPEGTLTVPADQVHLLIIRVIIEVWDAQASRLVDRPVIETHVSPAETGAVRVTLRHYPIGLSMNPGEISPESDPATLRAALLMQTEWLPVLERRGTKVALCSFTQEGDVNTLTSMPVAAQIGGAAGRAVGAFGDALSGGDGEADEADSGSVLTAEWLEYEIRAPGCEPRTIRREEFDLVGPAARSAGVTKRPELSEQQRLSRSLSLAGVTDSLVIGFTPSRRYAMHRAAQDLLVQRRAWQAVLSEQDAKRRSELALDLEGRGAPLVSMAAARGAFSSARGRALVGRINVLNCKSQSLAGEVGGPPSVRDLMDLAVSDTLDPHGDFWTLVAQGVADSAAESAVLHGDKPSPRNVLGLTEPETQAPELLVLRDAEGARAALERSAASPDVQARVLGGIAEGYAIVFPASAGGSADLGWWRVDPATGQTLGVMDNGYHADDTAEYTVVKSANPLDKTFVPQRAPSFWKRNAHDVLRDMGGREGDMDLLEMILDLQEKMRLAGVWL